MEALSPPPPAIDLSANLYYQVVHTLNNLLPPPLEDTPEALSTRNRAAIAKVAALNPVNANEVELAAQCIAARAQAEDLLRLVRHHAGDMALGLRLNAQYGSMVRTSLAVHGRLMRVQTQRHKREAMDGAADQDAWTQYIVERSMLAAAVVDPKPGPLQMASPERAWEASPERAWEASPEGAWEASPEGTWEASSEAAPAANAEAAPIATQPTFPDGAAAACADEETGDNVSRNKTNSHHTGFETCLSEQPWNQAVTVPGEAGICMIAEVIAKSHLACPDLPACGRESASTADYKYHREAETESA